MRNTGLKINEAVEILKYEKNNDRYLDEIKLLWQVIEKALPIAEVLYLRYSILFIFDNSTSHLVYAEDILYAHKMNKKPGGKQIILAIAGILTK